jgi:hypothetical protein
LVVLTPAGKQVDAGRFLRNDEAGVDAVEGAVQKWLSNQVVTPPKSGKPQ